MRGSYVAFAVAMLLGATAAGATTPNPIVTPFLTRVGATGAHPTVLAADADPDTRVAATPDGRRLAFSTGSGIWISTGDPRTNRLVAPPLDGVAQLAWSADGRRLAIGCASGGCPRRVTVVDVDDGQTTTLPFPATAPALSRNGTRVAVVRPDAGGVVVATIAGGILRDFPAALGAAFAPRTNALALVVDSPRGPRICVAGLGSAAPRCRATGVDPVWSPDGRAIAFRATSNYGLTSRVAVVPATGAPRSRLVSGVTVVGPDPGLSWSPGGRLLAFGGWGLHVVTARGRTLVGGDSTCSVHGTAFTRDAHVVYAGSCPG